MSTPPLTESTAVDAENPWPGLSAFDESAQRFFNGRDAESNELRRLVGQAPLTVLFGKSGLGKTSLVRAGLFPRLRQQNILPVYIRLDVRDGSAPLIEQAAAALRSEIARQGVDAVAPNASASLWEHLHGREVAWWSRKNQSLIPLFVFDQFEEVFTLGVANAAGVEQLQLDLADLVENRIPVALARRIEAGESTEHLDLRGQRYKILLSFREDFLPEVEGWKSRVPALMRNRLRLLPMSADRALQVVSGKTPAGMTHQLVSDQTAREIVAFVAAAQTGEDEGRTAKTSRKATALPWDRLELEPALLSLVCAGLNEKRKARGQATIDGALLAETGAAIIGDFYRGCVVDVPEKTRRFIEDALITEGGFRNSYPLQDALDQGLLDEPVLRQLVDRRLLRIDHQFGADRVELIHDRLTDAVREHRDQERDRVRARRQRRVLWVGGVTVITLFALGAMFFVLWVNAKRAREEVQVALRDLEREKAVAESEKERADAQAARAEADKNRAESATEQASRSLELEARAAAEAKAASDAATAALREAIAGKLALESRAILDGQRTATTDVALLLAAAGYRLKSSNEAYSGLQYALQRTAGVVKVIGVRDAVVAISAGGRSAVTLAKDDTLRVWNVGAGQPQGAPLRHARNGEFSGPRVAFSADGRTLVSSSGDKTLRLWDVATGQPRGTFSQKGAEWLGDAVFSPDGTALAFSVFAENQRSWRVVDIATGAPRGFQVSRKADIGVATFSPDGKTIASTEGATVRLWDAATGQARAELSGHADHVLSVAFSPDGRTIVSGGLDKTLRLWDANTGHALFAPLEGHTDSVLSVTFSADGKSIVSTGSDKTVRLWDAATGQPRGAPLEGHTAAVRRAAFAGDGTTLVSGSDDGTLRLWPIPGSQSMRGIAGKGHEAGVLSVAFSPDGATVASGSYDGTVRLWDAATGQPRESKIARDTKWVTSVSFSPDGKLIASAAGSLVRLWRVDTGVLHGTPLDKHRGLVLCVAFSRDGKTLASAGHDMVLWLWDTATGRVRRGPLAGHTEMVTSVAFSPDGKTIVSGSSDRTLRRWDATTGRALGAPIEGHTAPVQQVSFSPDAKTIMSVSDDGTLRLWDAVTGKPRRAPVQGSDWLASAAFSPDGKTIVSGDVAGKLRLWDATGEPLGAPLSGHTQGVDTVAFSPDGRTIVSGSRDMTLRWWDAPSAWIDRVCAKVVRNLSRSEWKLYVGDVPYETQCPGSPVQKAP
jgi:WD40 repeat protein